MNPSDSRPLILVICDYYLPGFESGGAMRTLVNMVDRLSDRFNFRIVTRDHDGPLNRTPYSSVLIGEWNPVGNAKVYYLSRENVRIRKVRELIEEVRPAAIYINSFFSPLTVAVLTLRRLSRIGNIPVVLAPEGELSPGALSVKRLKKQLYLSIAKPLKLLSSLVWKAASEPEVSDIRREVGAGVDVWIAPNMPPSASSEVEIREKPPKKAGAARMVFLSRFMRKKNFNWLARHLGQVKGQISIDIWGPLEDPEYWNECREIIANLPDNVEITARGPVAFEYVHDTLIGYHFFILPTLGENFGHVFVEALAAGCPLVTSDRTPWRDLEANGIGWDLSLDEADEWVAAINKCVAMEEGEYQTMAAAAREYAVKWLSDPELETSNAAVLSHAVSASAKR